VPTGLPALSGPTWSPVVCRPRLKLPFCCLPLQGFESIQYLHTDSGSYLLGMCEGNYCEGGSRGREPGNGRIIVSQLKFDK
jgi:hypothetical protein